MSIFKYTAIFKIQRKPKNIDANFIQKEMKSLSPALSLESPSFELNNSDFFRPIFTVGMQENVLFPDPKDLP